MSKDGASSGLTFSFLTFPSLSFPNSKKLTVVRSKLVLLKHGASERSLVHVPCLLLLLLLLLLLSLSLSLSLLSSAHLRIRDAMLLSHPIESALSI